MLAIEVFQVGHHLTTVRFGSATEALYHYQLDTTFRCTPENQIISWTVDTLNLNFLTVHIFIFFVFWDLKPLGQPIFYTRITQTRINTFGYNSNSPSKKLFSFHIVIHRMHNIACVYCGVDVNLFPFFSYHRTTSMTSIYSSRTICFPFTPPRLFFPKPDHPTYATIPTLLHGSRLCISGHMNLPKH